MRNQAAIRAKFVEDFGDDPALWEAFLTYARTASEGVYRDPPVTAREFFTTPYYVGAMAGNLYPAVLDALCESQNGDYIESVLTGGIGTSKTTIALLGTMYAIYRLSRMWDPQAHFGLLAGDEIVIAFQSVSGGQVMDVIYPRFVENIANSPYFQDHFKPDPKIKAELRFPNRVIVRPMSGSEQGAIGQNVLMGVLDEVNFMAVVRGSKKSTDSGTYDQAQALYNAIRRRRESRFLQAGGALPGVLYLVSSKRYPGEFTDQRMDAARRELAETGKTRTHVYDNKIWDVQPHKFGKARFRVFIGDETRQPRVMRPDEELPEADVHLELLVPEEYRGAFDDDILNALRDIGGTSTLAVAPFIINTQKIAACFGRVESVLSRPDCDFKETSVKLYPKRFLNIKEPRFVHIDLASTGDSAGVACGHVSKFLKMDRGDNQSEILPEIVFDFLLEVRPPKNGEIIFEKIRKLIYTVRDLGIPVQWVTLDSYQSRDTIQIMKAQGFVSGLSSMDTSLMPYSSFKTAILDGRVLAPEHDKCRRELARLEYQPKKGKVDHPVGFSKDVADAAAGVAYGLYSRRELWARHSVLAYLPKTLPKMTASGPQSEAA